MSDTAIKYRDEQVLEGYLEKVNPINPVSPTKDWQKMLRDSLDKDKETGEFQDCLRTIPRYHTPVDDHYPIEPNPNREAQQEYFGVK